MTYRISYRRYVTAAMAIAALIINVPTATAQPTQQQAQILSGLDEAVKAIGDLPRVKKLSPQARRRLVEFVMGNTLFAMAHEIGHGLINEMNMPVLGREEDAAELLRDHERAEDGFRVYRARADGGSQGLGTRR